MDISSLIEENLRAVIQKLYGFEPEKVPIEHPENMKFGDFASGVSLQIASRIKQSPIEVAKNICYELGSKSLVQKTHIGDVEIFEKIETAPPGFINFRLSKEWLHFVLYEILASAKDYGVGSMGKGKKVFIEYSQPNPNKPMHIGHARNNFLGSSLASIYRTSGYEVLTANYINDWGTHICKSMLMYKKYGNNAKPDKKPDHFVGEFYVMYEKEEAKDPGITQELAEMFRKLEDGDLQTIELWRKITGWVYEGWKSTYEDENVSFDVWMYQHDYKDTGKEIVNIALEKGIAERDETGAVVARLEKFDIPDKVLLRSDGTSIYSTQDLQLAKDTFENYQLDERFYVVDYRQSDYFKQIFKILEILGFEWAKRLVHVPYGVVKLPEGQMSSRKGTFVTADEVYARLVQLELEEVQKSIEDEKIAMQTAQKVALAAFRYWMLKVDPIQDITFDFSAATRFDGNTGPYLMYTYARTNSILDKAGFRFSKEGFEIDTSSYPQITLHEETLLRHLYKYPEIVLKATQDHAPNTLCNYLFELAQAFNGMYGAVQILSTADEKSKNLRLLLTAATGQVLKNGLQLLGIEVVSRM